VAEVIPLPRYFEAHTTQRLEGLTEELGAQLGAAVSEQSLTSILEQIAFETGVANARLATPERRSSRQLLGN
jgi:hypothetical protein